MIFLEVTHQIRSDCKVGVTLWTGVRLENHIGMQGHVILHRLEEVGIVAFVVGTVVNQPSEIKINLRKSTSGTFVTYLGW